ncbi:hypothetical protein P353_15975 [Comamonas testosteroni]|uniref:Uncharacterized protein n=1 Tax=Comamonas testosteroni TaxID=285 RepID=A0A096FD14_COMTE|nr:hypothetical protein P353_15975 [Comamonas testosteroni]
MLLGAFLARKPERHRQSYLSLTSAIVALQAVIAVA